MESLLRIGSCSFTAPGWEKVFYPPRLPKKDYLRWYSGHFDTLEIDSTFYAIPAPPTVRRWYAETPPHFAFALKAPRTITHDQLLEGSGADLAEFTGNVALLREKLAWVLLQFPYIRPEVLPFDEFLSRLRSFARLLTSEFRFAVEIRNREWFRPELIDLLNERNITVALTDHPSVPLPDNAPAYALDHPAYVRLLGDRLALEAITKSFDKTVVDKDSSIRQWVSICREIVHRGVPVSLYVNNHYAGYAPDTIARFLQLWDGRVIDTSREQRNLPF